MVLQKASENIIDRQKDKYLGSEQDRNGVNHQEIHYGKKVIYFYFFCHIVRRNGGIEKQILQGTCSFEGRRGRGRPATSWTDDVKTVCSHGVYGATKLALDRRRWRALVTTTAAQLCAI